MASTEVTFDLSPSHGLHTAREALDWFLQMMREHEEFEVETDRNWGSREGKKDMFPLLKTETGGKNVGYGPQDIS